MKPFFKGLALLVTVILFSNDLYPQLCQGSLGDPLINITFGAGPNPGVPLSAAATSMFQQIAQVMVFTP